MPTTRQREIQNSMFRTPVHCFFPDFLRAQNMPFELSRVKLYRSDLRGNKNYFELARGSSYRGGKITVNVWRTSRGNRFWFELARGSSWRGFELSGVNCMTRHASCCVPLCTINFKNSPGLHFIEYQRHNVFFLYGCFGSTAKKPSLKLFHGAFFQFFSR